jgi:serine protease AprX
MAATFAQAQTTTWVYFKDKCSPNHDYFAAEVCPDYVSSLQEKGITILGTSKWLNAACVASEDVVKTTDLYFVAHTEPLGKYTVETQQIQELYSYGEGDWQIEMMGLDQYHLAGFTGKGVKLALFDGGFYKVDSLPIFDSLWANNQIIASRDFVTNDTLTWRESTHGMQVLALAGINYPDSMVGAAPGASFVLARTEVTSSERHVEELNWLRAMEWADSIGVDIIHSSLGYSEFDSLEGDYTYFDMDGKSTLITIAAEQAASRGIFITNSAGNLGNKPWYYITAPCDGINVLCIGAVDSFKTVANFSSRGPTSDGRIKPDVTAMGRNNTVPDENGILKRGSGTSFSGPLVAGLVACLKGAHPTKTNAQITEAILKSSDRYFTPDIAYGHGIPNAMIADSILKTMPVLGIGRISKLEVSVYPNPAQDYLKIRTEPGATYTLRNTQGMVVQEGSLVNWVNFVDVRELVSGSYNLRVAHNNSIANQMVVIW